LPNGLLAIGCSDGELKLLDPLTGEYLKPWPDLNARIIGTPASFLRQIYVTTSDGHVAMVDSNGTLKTKVSVGAPIASSPLVTACVQCNQKKAGLTVASGEACGRLLQTCWRARHLSMFVRKALWLRTAISLPMPVVT
jgi:hypothetical protein